MSEDVWGVTLTMAEGLVQLFILWLAIQIVWSGLRGKGLGF